MKSSVILAATGAALGLASAIDKRDYVTEVEIEVVYKTVTVTAGEEPTASAYVIQGGSHRTRSKKPESSSTPAPSPTYVEVIVTPEPQPTYVAEPEPEPTTQVYVESPTQKASPTSQALDAQPSDFISAALYHHNCHRSNHSAPAVTWSDELAQWAANSASACNMEHDMGQGGGGYGQNLASWGTSESLDALGETGAVSAAASDMWYGGEYPSYAPYFGENPGGDFSSWGHLTQVLWAGTEEIGCHVQKCLKGTMYDGFNAFYVVCNYRPAGNIAGGYASNVRVPLGYSAVKSS